jgi:hypothetical protein
MIEKYRKLKLFGVFVCVYVCLVIYIAGTYAELKGRW